MTGRSWSGAPEGTVSAAYVQVLSCFCLLALLACCADLLTANCVAAERFTTTVSCGLCEDSAKDDRLQVLRDDTVRAELQGKHRF